MRADREVFVICFVFVVLFAQGRQGKKSTKDKVTKLISDHSINFSKAAFEDLHFDNSSKSHME